MDPLGNLLSMSSSRNILQNPAKSSKGIAKGPIKILNPHLLDIPLDHCHGNKMAEPAPLQSIPGVQLPATPPAVAKAAPVLL